MSIIKIKERTQAEIEAAKDAQADVEADKIDADDLVQQFLFEQIVDLRKLADPSFDRKELKRELRRYIRRKLK